MNDILITATPAFKKSYKKLHANIKELTNDAIEALKENPILGEMKKGDLAGIYVYKYRFSNQEYILACAWNEATKTITLLRLGSHENFYRDLKQQI